MSETLAQVNLHDVTRHLIGRSYRSVGDCWELVRMVRWLLGMPWPKQGLPRGVARHEKFYHNVVVAECVCYSTSSPGRMVILRTPRFTKQNALTCAHPYRWHCGVMLDGRWFLHAAASGVIKSRVDDMNYGPFIQGYFDYCDEAEGDGDG